MWGIQEPSVKISDCVCLEIHFVEEWSAEVGVGQYVVEVVEVRDVV